MINKKREEQVNALFDEGAQRSWMTRRVAKRLGLRTKSRELLILSGFANAPTAPKYYYTVELVVVTIGLYPQNFFLLKKYESIELDTLISAVFFEIF